VGPPQERLSRLRIDEVAEMIARIWHGWTTESNADTYERLLRDEIFPGIAAKKVKGYKRIQLLRRRVQSGEYEFTTIMWFDDWDAVRQFGGPDYEKAYVPPQARAVLARFDEFSQHYELRSQISY
jgi:hypothetical protein